MAPTQPGGHNGEDSTGAAAQTTWNNAEVKALLGELTNKKLLHMSGNGFKPQVWPSLVAKVHAANLNTNLPKDKQKFASKLAYLKKTFELYFFVKNKSGMDCDDEEKHATGTDDHVEDFNASISCAGSKARQLADTEDKGSDIENIDKPERKRQYTPSGGAARRNSEAGTQISHALNNLLNVMAQLLVTSEDLSYITNIVAILKDATLLPENPCGKYYRTVSKHLSADPALACVFILEEDRTRRITLLDGSRV
ncbi:hypothetical protein C8R43DRAFT_1134925 [Mycena crocata]|nr:hypothetical protein C8R43DRAFT_1134925 [Mycena crocata]